MIHNLDWLNVISHYSEIKFHFQMKINIHDDTSVNNKVQVNKRKLERNRVSMILATNLTTSIECFF